MKKAQVIKLDTIQRLAELLKISPLSLLGIGVEYYSRPVGYFERIRQIEETADQILQVDGPFCYLTSTDAYDGALTAAFEEAAEQAGSERAGLRANAEQVLGIMAARKRMHALRKPGIIAMLPVTRMRQFLQDGVGGSIALSERTRRICRQVAASELQHIADMMEAEPMGLQFGLLDEQRTKCQLQDIARARPRDAGHQSLPARHATACRDRHCHDHRRG